MVGRFLVLSLNFSSIVVPDGSLWVQSIKAKLAIGLVWLALVISSMASWKTELIGSGFDALGSSSFGCVLHKTT